MRKRLGNENKRERFFNAIIHYGYESYETLTFCERERLRETDRQTEREREIEIGFPGFPKIVSVFPRKIFGFRE